MVSLSHCLGPGALRSQKQKVPARTKREARPCWNPVAVQAEETLQQAATALLNIVPGRLRESNAYESVRMHCGSAKAALRGGTKSIGHRPAVRST